jgi:two-component system sensor histidine kinase BaeS
VVAFVIVGRAFARVVGPLARIATAADRLADGETGVRVDVPRGQSPVARLGTSFNAMADRLDRSRADRQALLADVTHELRTPLAVIAGNVEAMRDGVHPRDDAHLGAVLAETAVMDRLLDDLRTLSLADAGALPIHREPLDVRPVLEQVALAHAVPAAERAVALAVTPGPGLPAELDPVRLREIVAILVVNALRHTPAGGSVTLAARAIAGSDDLEITVTDTGEGIDAADLERIFTRFVRRSDAGGSGLGLTIARGLVTAHGGTIVAESAGPGRGATFRVRLPARG